MSYQAKFYLVNSTPQETTLCEISHIYHLPEVCCIMIYLKVQILQTTFILNWTSSKWNGRNTESLADEMAMAESQNQLLMQETKFLFPFHFIVLEIVSLYLLWGKALQLTTIATKYTIGICWKNEWNWHYFIFSSHQQNAFANVLLTAQHDDLFIISWESFWSIWAMQWTSPKLT